MNDFTGRVRREDWHAPNGFRRTVTVAMDTAQYQMDINHMQAAKGEDLYGTFNVVMRRKPKARIYYRLSVDSQVCVCLQSDSDTPSFDCWPQKKSFRMLCCSSYKVLCLTLYLASIGLAWFMQGSQSQAAICWLHH